MEHTGDFPKLEPQIEWLMEHPMDGETFPVFVKEEESEDLYANNTHSEFDLLGNDTDYEENQSWPGKYYLNIFRSTGTLNAGET